MNKALIMLGSNVPERSLEQVRYVIRIFQENYIDVLFTEIYQTPYEGTLRADVFDYVNALGWVSFEQEFSVVQLKIKVLERQLGRFPEQKKTGIVAIDIDLLQWNENRLKPEEWSKEYFRKGWEQLNLLGDKD